MNLSNCYRILGISSEVSIDEVYLAYRELSAEWHPRRHESTPDNRAAASKRWEEIYLVYFQIGLMETQSIWASVAAQDLPK